MKKLILLLTFLFICSPVHVLANTNTSNQVNYVSSPKVTGKEYFDAEVVEGFKFVAENEQLELYVEESTVAIAIRNKQNGYIWYSYDVNEEYEAVVNEQRRYADEVIKKIKSGVNIEYYEKSVEKNKTAADENTVKTYQFNDTGFVVTVDFTDLQIKFDLEVSLHDDQLKVHVPDESIKEYDPDLFKVGNYDNLLKSIKVFEYFGMTKSEENGYYFLPDGSGALVELLDVPKYVASYSRPIYGEDYGYLKTHYKRLFERLVNPTEQITMPVYGVVQDEYNNAMFVVSNDGESYGFFNYNSRDIDSEYYSMYFSYRYRRSYQQFQSRVNEGQFILGYQETVNPINLTQTYHFLTNDDASYVGMAKRYKSYLNANNQLTEKEDSNKVATNVKVVGRDVTVGLFDLKSHVVTDYSETKELVERLLDDGFEDLNLLYTTFRMNEETYGAFDYSRFYNRYRLDDLVTDLDDLGVQFGYYIDYVTLYGSEKRKAADGLSKTSPFKTIDSWNYGTHYINGYDSLLIDSKNESDILDSFGISNIAIDGLDQALLTQYVEKVLKTREDGKEFVTESLDVFNGTLGLFNPDAYLYPYVDKMYDTPVTSSDLLVASTSVPFLQLVLGDHVEMYSRELNFINNEDITLLKLIEHGVSPSYTLTLDETFELEYTNFYEVYISEYDAMRRRMMSYNDFIKEGLLISQNNEMVDHRYVMENVVLSTFSNGKQILINYNNYQIEYDGIKVNALDYEVN